MCLKFHCLKFIFINETKGNDNQNGFNILKQNDEFGGVDFSSSEINNKKMQTECKRFSHKLKIKVQIK